MASLINREAARAKIRAVLEAELDRLIPADEKRVKGTEQFWHEEGVEPILALRALWLGQDQRRRKHWTPDPLNPRNAA